MKGSRPSAGLPPDEALFEALARAVASRSHRSLRLPRRAAVAVLLRERGKGTGPEVLLIRRAARRGDPWSGHMALPGGRVERRDASPWEAAVRETREEVGLELHRGGTLLGPLPERRAFARGRPTDLAVSPFLVHWHGTQRPRTSEEVDEWLWTPLAPLLRGERDTRYRHRLRLAGLGLPVDLPAYEVEGRIVWGLTWRILRSLRDVLTR